MHTTVSETILIFDSVKGIPADDWNSVVPREKLFLSLPYLSALEEPLKKTIQSIYILIYDADGQPILAGIFQVATFTYKKVSQKNLFIKLFQDCRNDDDSFSIKGLVCGNMFATGEHGFVKKESISKKLAFELLAKAAKKIQKDSRWEDSFSVILFKEFYNQTLKSANVLEDLKYRSFQADVNMVLTLDPNWITFSDYLKSMKAKYRTKAKSAFKKSESLKIKSLSTIEIQKYQDRIQSLFNQVIDKSDYKYGENYPASFALLKEKLGDAFICNGVFSEDTLVGFSTAFVNGNNLEASYVGLDYQLNTEFAVYERLLYQFVEDALELKINQLHLGRTSELIKSALGALPVEMTLFARHTSKIKNVLLKPILENISPSPFELRKPFSVPDNLN